MSSLTSRLGLIKPNDVVGIEDDLVDVTAQIADSYDKIDAAVGIVHVANFAALPATLNFIGRLAQTDDDGAIWEYNAGWKFWRDTRWQTGWNPQIFVQTGTITLGSGGGRQARYFREGDSIKYGGWCYTGTTGFSGGSGKIDFNIPYTAKNLNGVVSWGQASVAARGEDFDAFARIDPAGTRVGIFVDWYDTGLGAGNQRIRRLPIQNCDNGGAALGTGLPRFSGVFTWEPSQPGYINWNIEYPFDINSPIASTP